MNTQVEQQRLDRIEIKLDKLAEAVVTMARMEERMVTVFSRIQQYEEKQERLSSRIYDLEKTSASRSPVFRFGEKILWIVLSAAVATAFWYVRNPGAS